MKRLVTFATCVVLFGTTLLGQTVTLFSDNFELYTAGANLAGQGGWTGCGSIPVGTSSALPTKVARADLGSAGCSGGTAGFAYVNHSFPGSIGDNVVTTLSFDAYAPIGAHNGGVSLTDMGGDTINGLFLYPDISVGGWNFILYKNGSGADQIHISGGTGAPVSFKVVIDVPNQIAYAIYNFGGGPQTTSSFSLAANTTLGQWKTVSIFADYRFGYPQEQIDNISITQTSPYNTCLLYDPTKATKSGSTIPIKLQLCNSSGANLSSSSITVHAVSITQTSTSISGPVEDSGNANPDNDFRYDSTLGDTGGYIFNLKTTGFATGTYNLNFTVGSNPGTYSVQFQVK